MKKKPASKKDRLLKKIDRAILKSNMNKEETLSMLESLLGNLENKCDLLYHEIKNKGKKND